MQARGAGQPRKGKGQVPHVAVDHVELARMLEDPRQLEQMQGQIVLRPGIQSQRAWRRRNELGSGLRVAAREERDVMPSVDQLFGDVPDDPLRAPVESGRHTLVQGCDLSDAETRAHDLAMPPCSWLAGSAPPAPR